MENKEKSKRRRINTRSIYEKKDVEEDRITRRARNRKRRTDLLSRVGLGFQRDSAIQRTSDDLRPEAASVAPRNTTNTTKIAL